MGAKARETAVTLDPERAWAAVEARDAGCDGEFVYAVASTGVYCRPSCPARRPRRERVAFFPHPGAAEAAGYRACRRCRPRAAAPYGAPAGQGPGGSNQPGQDGPIERARLYLEAHIDETVTLERLGREVGLSPYHLQRTFKRATGVSPKDYVLARRLERFKARLKKGDTVTTATFEAGYGAGSRLYEQANARLGMTPGTFRRGGRGMRIGYAVVACPLGMLLVGATARGICAVKLGNGEAELLEGLRREFPAAELGPAEAALQSWVEEILAALASPARPLDLPLDVGGTPFEWRVWRALQEIPPGATRSYGEVAAAIGAPGAARAVARACAANRAALVIPCHRVVRGDGEIGGYRWGTERKRRLLQAERAGTASRATS
jgi:AraC family transcriptional regulator, regulatory protein of adaptative response / methylated-DNA-[protein]-cysteine methyltransferase